jgi:hypothetical protein
MKTAITIAIRNPIRINRDPIFILHSDPDFSGKLGSWFSFSNRIAMEKPGPGPVYRRMLVK